MAEETRERLKAGTTRRDLVVRAGIGGAILATGGAQSAFASVTRESTPAANLIKIGFVSPLTGPAAGFGEPDGYVIGLARKAFANGLQIGGKKYAVQIIQKDSQSNPARAAQVANGLINDNKIDMMLCTSTPENNNPISDACEAAGIPCVSTVEPWEAWFFGRKGDPKKGFKWVYHFAFGVADFVAAYTSQWSGPVTTNKKVGVMWPNDADGNAIRSALGPALEKAGFTIVDPGAYEDGTNDYSSQIAKFKAENCEIFNTFPIPPDFATFWRQAAQQGYTSMVKIAQVAKTGLFPSQVEALGALGPRLSSAAYWTPTFPYASSLTRLTSQQLGTGYQVKTGKQWNQCLGTSMALFDVAAAALKASGNPKSKVAVSKAMKTLKVSTPVGSLNWAKGPVPNVVSTPLIGTQWVTAKAGSKYKLANVVTEHADDKRVPVAATLKPYS